MHDAFPPAADRSGTSPAGRLPHVRVTPPPPPNRRRDRLLALVIALVVALANVALWRELNPALAAADYDGPIAGLAYNAFQRWDSPLDRRYPGVADVEADMALLGRQTRRLRTYSASELPWLPDVAEQHGLKITAGVWLDQREDNNRREIAAIQAATAVRGPIERVIAGNETLLLGILKPEQLIAHLDELRRTLRVPVSTAEPWHIWLKYPELAKHVDYVTIHLLPYWEGVPAEVALDYAMQRYEEVKKAFPDKHVTIGEIGWPSQGDRYDGAWTSPDIQARFIRDFLARTRGQPLDYFLMEAIDQPWKTANEGRVGAYWGIFHADRSPKFDFAGPVTSDPQWTLKAALASLLALGPMTWFLARFARMRLASRLAFCGFLQASASLVVWLVALPFDYYLRGVDWAALSFLLPTLLLMVAILLANGFEFAEMFWPGNLRRRFEPIARPAGGKAPFVSVHLACCNEPPEMVIATIDSLLRLDYPEFEVLVIDNNTKDEALWKPVQAHVATLGPRFRFFHLPNWPGFKAGALNFALDRIDPRTEVVGVVDADYVVKRDWLSGLIGWFADPKVAVVQAPQAHRDWNRQPFRRFMNFEYDGFFRIGMHHRNERDAIVQHGTMTLIRAEPLLAHGKWSEWTICEDTELGLRMMEAGYTTVYVDRVMGEGLVPDDFAAFKKQRRRWALGAMQIMKGHARPMLRAGGTLTPAQRYHFVSGWLPWIGDALHLVFAYAAMLWTIGIVAAPHLFSLPILLFMVPLFGFFGAKALFGPMLYLRRVHCGPLDLVGAALAGMGLSHSIAMGVFAGLTSKRGVFEITKKASRPGAGDTTATTAGAATGAGAPPAAPSTRTAASVTARARGRLHAALQAMREAIAPVREETALLAGLTACVIAMLTSRKADHIESALWIGVLVLQAIPYAAALACQALSRLPERPADAPLRPVPARPLWSGRAWRPLPLPVEVRRAGRGREQEALGQRTAQR